MTASFLGITAHFFTYLDKKHHNITLAVRCFQSPHTGKRIVELFQAIIDEWKIQHKVFRVLTDNGSNMKKAFRLGENESESDEDSGEDVPSNCNDENLLDCQDDDNSDSETEYVKENSTDNEIHEDDQFETEQTLAFSGWKRNSCFVHTL